MGGLFTVALAQGTTANQHLLMASAARRLLQQDLEQVRRGGGAPSSGTSGPFTVSVTTWNSGAPSVIAGSPPWTPDCHGASPCSSALTLTGIPGMTYVAITITNTADGTVMARGTTTATP